MPFIFSHIYYWRHFNFFAVKVSTYRNNTNSSNNHREDMRLQMCVPMIKILTFSAISIPLAGQISFIRHSCTPIQPGFFLNQACNTPDNLQIPKDSFVSQLVLPFPSSITVILLCIILLNRGILTLVLVMHFCISAPVKVYCLHAYISFTKM